MKNVGIIGNGFVGNAIATGLIGYVDNIRIFDIQPERSSNTLYEVVNSSDVIFVSVPTPMTNVLGGEIDLSVVRSAFSMINKIKRKSSEPVFVLKSTVVPGTMESLCKEFPGLNLVFSPEFLTERFARLDFINSARIVLGGAPDHVAKVADVLHPRFPGSKFIKTDFATSQLIKYMANCFFALKVSFMNEMYQCASACDADWDTALSGFISDGRIGNSHLQVPGHDGDMGFGGKCFPKDLNAMIHWCEDNGIKPTTLKAAWDKNLEVRKNLDWKEIAGAVSNDE